MPVICCEELAYAVTTKVVTDCHLGTVLVVKDPDNAKMTALPFKHCPWCATEIPRNSPVFPVILYPDF